MIGILKQQARLVLERVSSYYTEHEDARLIQRRERALPRSSVRPTQQHLDAAIAWLKLAQDAAGDGVSWGYRARRPVRSVAPLGWQRPYPETTGYIIPTFLRYADLSGDSDCLERARRMADWELAIQLEDGGIQGGMFGAENAASSTFVTGQVLFGLLAAHHRFGDGKYLRSAIRAGDFLLDCLDDTGRFTKGYSRYCAAGPKAYEVRTGWALALLGEAAQESKYLRAAGRMADYALSCQAQNGWFGENDLEDHTEPLTHTIGYVMEGLEGIGTVLSRQDCLDAVGRTLNALCGLVPADGSLQGKWREDWTPAVSWICLTGSSQIAGVFLRRHILLPNQAYLDAGQRLLGFVAHTQQTRGASPGTIGGIRGSYPFDGGYGQWCVLNWATKFFADSVMDFLNLCEAERG